MSETRKIRTALVSVYHKDGLEALLKKLNDCGVQFVSTGGTRALIQDLGYTCRGVEEFTGYPSILGGRVKTLHPKIFGGILARRSMEADRAQMLQYEIPPIDLVIVDLYPFEDTVTSGASMPEVIEKIDIGGISLIRAAAKNFADVVVVPDKAHYSTLLGILEAHGAQTELEERLRLAVDAFKVSSHYDTAIHSYLATTEQHQK